VASGAGKKRKVVEDAGEAHLRDDAAKRKQLADRLDAMLSRRSVRTGDAGQDRGKKEVVGSAVVITSSNVDETGQVKKTAAKVAYPEADRLKDMTGLKKLAQKRTKAIRKEAKAAEGAEDEDAPDTANALHELKGERGECGWDFEDEEMFSDDEQETCDFNDQLKVDDDLEAPSGDEEIGEECEKGDLLTSHGKQLEVLVALGPAGLAEDMDVLSGEDCSNEEDGGSRGLGPGGASPSPSPTEPTSVSIVSPSGASSVASRRPAASAVACLEHPIVQLAPSIPVTPAKQPAEAAQTKARGDGVPAASAVTASKVATPVKKGTHVKAIPGVPASSTPKASPAARKEKQAPSSGRCAPEEVAELRDRVVACLQLHGGRCSLKFLLDKLGLSSTDKQSPLYTVLLNTLQQVAKTTKQPGEKRAQLVLKDKLRLPTHR
jgi:hypothetical protein